MNRSILLSILLTSTTMTTTVLAARNHTAMTDASALLSTESRESGRAEYSPGHGVAFKPSDHVFVLSALAVDFDYRNATVTLPLFRGVSPSGKDQFFIITDASDFQVARRMGINYAPKLSEAIETPGVQQVTL